jgi:hypothetical protein
VLLPGVLGIQMNKYFGRASALVLSLMAAVPAFAVTDPLTDALTSIDLTAVGAAVAVIVVGVIAISMGFKGADLGKRAVRKV